MKSLREDIKGWFNTTLTKLLFTDLAQDVATSITYSDLALFLPTWPCLCAFGGTNAARGLFCIVVYGIDVCISVL